MPDLFFCLEVQSFRLEMEYYFIQMAASAGLTVPHSGGPISKHFFECLEPYLGNGITDVSLQMLNCLWMVCITLIFKGASQKIIQKCQIAASWCPIDITISANETAIEHLT